MGVLAHNAASLATSSRVGTCPPRQQLPNSITKNVTPEVIQINVSEQCPRSLGSRGDLPHLLCGWKEIANYMHLGVRTVQRWQAIGLPVRRVKKSRRAPVIALAEDLDAWARSLHVPLLDRIEELEATISSLESQIHSLRRQLRMRNRPAHMDRTPTSHAITQLSQNCKSGSPPRFRSNNSSAALTREPRPGRAGDLASNA